MRLNRVLVGSALLVSVGSAVAQDRSGPNLDRSGSGARGGVAMLVQAQDLYALGVAQKDAVSVLAAARLLALVEVRAVDRSRTTPAASDGADLDADAAADTVAVPVTADAMLAAARDLAGEDETLAGLIDAAETARGFGTTAGAQATLVQVAAGGADQWDIALFGGSPAEIAVLGNGLANLDVTVTDQNGTTVCVDVGASDRVYCDFTPLWNGSFTVRVENTGAVANRYHLLTN